MKRIFCILLGAIAAVAAVGCEDGMWDNGVNGALELSHSAIVVGRDATTVSVGVTARDAGWSVEGGAAWMEIAPASGAQGVSKFSLNFAANDTDGAKERTAEIKIVAGSEQKTIAIRQLNVPAGPELHADYTINRAVHAQLADWYYNGEPKEVTPDLNQSYEEFYYNYIAKGLTRNKEFDGTYWTKDNERFIYSYIERRAVGSTEIPLNYGMEFDLVEHKGRLVARVLYVEKGSPAATAGLRRGDWFYKVNGMELGNWKTEVGDFRYQYNRYIDTLVRPLEGISPRLGLMRWNGAQETLTDNGATVTLTPSRWRGDPVFHTQTFDIERLEGGTARVGYMMYNRFDDNFAASVTKAFAAFQTAEVDDVILDLRYNKSGSAKMAEQMGNLLVGGTDGVAGKTFAQYVFDKSSPLSAGRTATFAADAGGLALKRVFVIVSRHTAGPAELLVNALRGLDQSVVKLVLIGEKTQGLAAGMVGREVSVGEEIYTAWMLACRVRNDAGVGDYTNGFVPNGGESINEFKSGDNIKWNDVWGWKEQTTANQDQMVKRAVDMIRGNQNMPAGDVVASSEPGLKGLPRRWCFPANMIVED